MLPRFFVVSRDCARHSRGPAAGSGSTKPAAPPQTPEVLPVPGQGDNAPSAAGSDTPAEKKKEPGQTAGYAYSDKPAAGAAPRARFRQRGPVVNMPGFEQTSDGGSRLFVQLSQSVPVVVLCTGTLKCISTFAAADDAIALTGPLPAAVLPLPLPSSSGAGMRCRAMV